ncbi:MAG: pilus assembly protein [Chloroflexi bacterium]|nr:pilus assembly protein [Chloroflexota bacterium]
MTLAAIRAERGSALIEAALVLPILTTFLVGIVGSLEIARSYHAAGVAAREAVRVGAVYEYDRSSTAYENAVTARATDVARSHNLRNVNIAVTPGGRHGNTVVTVSASIDVFGLRTVTVSRTARETTASHAALDRP